jgi:hypothetical protein
MSNPKVKFPDHPSSRTKVYYDETRSIDLLITTTDQSKTPAKNEKILVFDKQKDRVEERSFFSSLLGGSKHLVAYKLYTKALVSVEKLIPVHQPHQDTLADILIEGTAAVLEGQEEKLVAFYHKHNAKHLLRLQLDRWIDEFFRQEEQQGKPKNITAYKDSMLQFVKERARLIGLDLDLKGTVQNTRDSHVKSKDLTIATALKNGTHVVVVFNLMLVLRDLRLYRTFLQSNQSLTDWVHDTLRGVLEKLLFQKQYADVISNFDNTYKPALRKAFDEKLRETGYEVDTFFLEIKDQLQGFQFDIEGTRNFATSEPGLSVRMALSAQGMFSDLGYATVKEMIALRSQVKTDEEVRKYVQHEVSEIIRETDVSAIRMDGPRQKDLIESGQLQEEIIRKLTDRLKKHYALESAMVTISSLGFYAADTQVDIHDLIVSAYQQKQKTFVWFQLNGKAYCSRRNKALIRTALAILADETSFHLKIKGWVGGYMVKRQRGEVGLYKEEIHALEKYLATVAEQEGIGLEVTLKVIREAASEIPVNENVNCVIQGGHHILVENHLLLRLEEPDRFTRSEIPDLAYWIRECLRTIIRNKLLKKSYLDLVLHFYDTYKDEIEQELMDEAGKIGYRADQIIFIPKIDELDLVTNGFSFELGEGIEFYTRSSDFKVKLTMAVSGKISDFTNANVRKYIQPTPPNFVITKMKERVEEITRQYIHTVEPNRYYMEFKGVREGDPGRSVEEELVESVRKMLNTEFSAVDLVIIPKGVETDLMVRFKRLAGKIHRVEVSTFSRQFSFELGYIIKIVHPEGWAVFNSLKYETMEEEAFAISKMVKNIIEIELNNKLPTKFMDVKDHRYTERVKMLAEEDCVLAVREKLGIEISIVDMERGISDVEQLAIDMHKVEVQKTRRALGYDEQREKIIEEDNLKSLEEALAKQRALRLGEQEVSDDDGRWTGIKTIKQENAYEPAKDLQKSIDGIDKHKKGDFLKSSKVLKSGEVDDAKRLTSGDEGKTKKPRKKRS